MPPPARANTAPPVDAPPPGSKLPSSACARSQDGALAARPHPAPVAAARNPPDRPLRRGANGHTQDGTSGREKRAGRWATDTLRNTLAGTEALQAELTVLPMRCPPGLHRSTNQPAAFPLQ